MVSLMQQTTAFRLNSKGPLRAASLAQMLLLYGVSPKLMDEAIDQLKETKQATLEIDNIPDTPIFLLGLQDCGITGHPLPF